MTGVVFDIKEFAVHDGPGVRVTTFLKGCPLRCKWCHNPEGLSPAPELSVRVSACEHCGACQKPCSHSDCQPFSRCLHACPKGLISVVGRTYGSGELSKKLLGYAPFFKDGGGLTFSGGEPLLQHAFLTELLENTRPLHRAIETSGFADPAVFRDIASRCDLVIMDIKLADSEKHAEYTGVPNDIILKNYAWLKASGIPHTVRVPLIPGVTDTRENLAAISRIVGGDRVELLRYNKAAGAKYPNVGRKFTLPPADNGKIDLSLFERATLL